MKVLFLVPYTTEGTSTESGWRNTLPPLRKQGADWVLRPFRLSGLKGVLRIR